ncbi:respiratory burst oxidaseprotein B [Hordeum vulgare]|nr:respiratory burst oxidaseprotein B [Hordeum vulgare]
MPSRVGADDADAGGSGGVGEIVEASGGVPPGNRSAARKTARFAEPVSAPCADDDGYGDAVEVTIDIQDYTATVRSMEPIAGGKSSHGRSVIQNAKTRIKQVAEELQRFKSLSRRGWNRGPSSIDRSVPARALEGLKFISKKTDGSDGWKWTDVEKCFREETKDGLIHRSKFAMCIGMKERAGDVAFAGALFDALSRRRNISGDTINMEELRVFWKDISDTSFDSRLGIFFDMVDKDANGVLDEKEVKDIITLSASANNLKMVAQKSEEYTRLIMEELDPKNRRYIEVAQLEALLTRPSNEWMQMGRMTISPKLSKLLGERRTDPNPLRRWYSRARYFMKDNWRRCWVMLLWLSICVGLFAWKFEQYRHRAVFKVMGYCVCVAKGGAETLKFNMALTLLPVCRNTITWLRSRTTVGQFVPFNDNLNFHKVIAVGISIGAGLHIISHLACDFPRLLHATVDEYEPMKPFFGYVKPPNYWWFVKGTEGWTGLVMLLLMAIAFTFAPGRLRKGTLRLPKPKELESLPKPFNRCSGFVNTSRSRFTGLVNASLKRFTGYNAFWYTHHLFLIVYALFIVHGHFLYLTKRWQKKSTWMYLVVPMMVYACERLTRTLRSSVRSVRKIKVTVHPHPATSLSLHLSKPQGFSYKSGQYIYVKCPAVSPFQWHPFSITSAPDDDYISVHIKVLGDWTGKLRDTFLRVGQTPEEDKSKIIQVEYDHDDIIFSPRYPKVLIDGPYGAPAQDYKQYNILLLVGLGIGATPMISIIKDIISHTKRVGNRRELPTRHARFYWVTREQGSLEWFRGVMDEVAEADESHIIELHNHCTSVYEKGDARSALITMLQSLHYAKNGVDVLSGGRVMTHFGRPNWNEVYKSFTVNYPNERVGVFYCGEPAMTKKLRKLSKEFSRNSSTKFEFHSENF